MIAVQKNSEVEVFSSCEEELRVERTDISFRDLPEDKVRISVRVHNDGASRSRPALIRLEAAALGAFARWQPLALLHAPPIESGESRELSLEAPRPRPTPLGSFDRVPPSKVATALAADEGPRRRTIIGLGATANFMARLQSGDAGFVQGNLPPDLMELLGRGPTHWAGNLNVFIGRRAVERHMAKALRIYPGRKNLAMFVVGERNKPESYSFEITGLAEGWKAALFDMTRQEALWTDSAPPVPEFKWVESDGMMMVILAALPPAGCEAGGLEVQVTRRSDQSKAVVEFNLDPAAQGPGCYAA